MLLVPSQFPRGLPRRIRPYSWPLFVLAVFVLLVEPLHHVYTAYTFRRPERRIDPPAHNGCIDPTIEAGSTHRQAAALFMLARNNEIDQALGAIQSLEEQFNQWFKYPWVFLNDEEWTTDFKTQVSAEIRSRSGAKVIFDTISKDMWDWPTEFDERDKAKARKTWDGMYNAMDTVFQLGTHVKKEGYHHMCRFNSGFFYDHPALKPFKYYWRVEPGVTFTCKIPYDPFGYMARTGKKYGYTIALYEVGSLIPGLFRATADWANANLKYKPALWNAMHEVSWAPWPVRRFILSHLGSRNAVGDGWNLCHFWSNFEIADLDFYRSREYRDYFKYMDSLGGFYFERWGDAPIHSLGAAMLLEPEQVHYFQDIGYGHPPFQHCPIDEGVGCDCACNKTSHVQQFCLDRVRETVEPW